KMNDMEKRVAYLQEWVDALRSGKYVQGKYRLHSIESDQDNFCCLGVACHIFAERENLHKEQTKIGHVSYNTLLCSLPDRLSEVLGINHIGELKKRVSNCGTLTGLNDHIEMTFAEIADVIEQQFLLPAKKQLS